MDIKMKPWNWAANSTEPGQTHGWCMMMAKANHLRVNHTAIHVSVGKGKGKDISNLLTTLDK